MDNKYQSPGGDPQDRRPTEQFWPMNSPAAGPDDPASPGYGPSPGPGAPAGDGGPAGYGPPAGHGAPPGYGPPGLGPGHGPPGYGPAGYGPPEYGPAGYGAGAGYGYQPQEPPGVRQHYARDRRKAMHWAAGITVAAILAAGAVIAGVALSGNATPAGSTAAGPTGQAAVLNATLSSADSPDTVFSATPSTGTGNSPAGGTTGTTARPCARAAAAARAARTAGHPRAARNIAAHCRGVRLRIARLLGGVHGEFTFTNKSGFHTLAYERGVIETVTNGSNIVVRAADGTTWTWDLVSDTVVRESGAKTAQSALAAGQPVWVGGPVNSGAKDARLIVIRPPAAATPSPAPSGSGS
jgi:hypothetical protein